MSDAVMKKYAAMPMLAAFASSNLHWHSSNVTVRCLVVQYQKSDAPADTNVWERSSTRWATPAGHLTATIVQYRIRCSLTPGAARNTNFFVLHSTAYYHVMHACFQGPTVLFPGSTLAGTNQNNRLPRHRTSTVP
eukprot:GHUV01011278.1.p2 GENE.GHUV01011278.1~~GHUV01011278.1.p2  ORF type:complete len:135 (-),score=23.40 GHUV01011278.1:1761-2165(-)